MDFGDILNDWERSTAKPYGKKRMDQEARQDRPDRAGPAPSGSTPATPKREEPRANPIDVWLRRNGVQDKDTVLGEGGEPESPAARRKRLHALRPEASIDLHGLTRDDAWARLEAFFADCRRRGLSKVLIIHGKGTHSENDPVLKGVVRLFLERNPHAGESGHSTHGEGGSGSTWVILK